MPMRNPAWLGRAALLPLRFAANAARSERESDGSAVGLGDLVTDAACAESGDALPLCGMRTIAVVGSQLAL